MYHFEYVDKETLMTKKNMLIALINKVQRRMREEKNLTFRYELVGSSKRNMVTYDPRTNRGYDFDVDIILNKTAEQYEAKEIKEMLRRKFDEELYSSPFKNSEDSTRVFTIKKIDYNSLFERIQYSCDFAIVRINRNNKKEYIRFNKKFNTYTWESQSKGFYRLPQKIEFCKENNLWSEVREEYLKNKNKNRDDDKKSRSIFAETVNQVYNRYC